MLEADREDGSQPAQKRHGARGMQVNGIHQAVTGIIVGGEVGRDIQGEGHRIDKGIQGAAVQVGDHCRGIVEKRPVGEGAARPSVGGLAAPAGPDVGHEADREVKGFTRGNVRRFGEAREVDKDILAKGIGGRVARHGVGRGERVGIVVPCGVREADLREGLEAGGQFAVDRNPEGPAQRRAAERGIEAAVKGWRRVKVQATSVGDQRSGEVCPGPGAGRNVRPGRVERGTVLEEERGVARIGVTVERSGIQDDIGRGPGIRGSGRPAAARRAVGDIGHDPGVIVPDVETVADRERNAVLVIGRQHHVGLGAEGKAQCGVAAPGAGGTFEDVAIGHRDSATRVVFLEDDVDHPTGGGAAVNRGRAARQDDDLFNRAERNRIEVHLTEGAPVLRRRRPAAVDQDERAGAAHAAQVDVADEVAVAAGHRLDDALRRTGGVHRELLLQERVHVDRIDLLDGLTLKNVIGLHVIDRARNIDVAVGVRLVGGDDELGQLLHTLVVRFFRRGLFHRRLGRDGRGGRGLCEGARAGREGEETNGAQAEGRDRAQGA